MEHAFKVSKGLQFIDEPDSNHGRIENRCCSILPACDYLLEENRSSWKNVATLIKIDASREIKGILQTDAFHKDELNACFSDAMPEVDKLGGVTGKRRHKCVLAAKVLVVGVLAPLLNHRFIG